jgi:hypothetical protein
MTKDAKGRGDNAPPAKPSPIAELRRRWPRYAFPLGLLDQEDLPEGTDKLRLAQRMIEACENCRSGLPERVEMARALNQDARRASHAARDLARFLRRYWTFPMLPAELEEAGRKAGLFLARRESGLVSESADGSAFLPILYAAMLEHLAKGLPRVATRGTAHRRRHGILFNASLLRKGRPTYPETACLFAVVFHARQATGAARDAWARNESAAIFGPMPKDGRPLYAIAAAFVCAALDLPEGTIGDKEAADRLALFVKRNPGAKPYQRTLIIWD